MALWIFAGLYLLVFMAVQRWWRRNVGHTYHYSHGRKWRTSRVWLFIKTWIVVSIPIYGILGLLGGPGWVVFGSTFVYLLGFVIVGEIFIRLAMGWWHDGDAGYDALCRDGYDCFFDSGIMGLLNGDPDEVLAGQPPRALLGSNWAAPANWTDQCPNCGARQPGPIFWCWHCGLGYEHRCQKMCCPDCNRTFCEAQPGIGRTLAITCPGCGKAWQFPE